MNNINIKQDDDAGQNSATVGIGRSSSFTPRRSTIAATSYTVLRTLMVLLLIRRPRRGDDEEVSNHRRSRGLLAAGGFVVLAYLRNAHSQPKSANTSPHSHLECEVPTHVSPRPRDGRASTRGEDSRQRGGLAWGLLRVVQIDCERPAPLFCVRVIIFS